jgi:hypothetical protein
MPKRYSLILRKATNLFPPGWTDITPPYDHGGGLTYGVTWVTHDPSNPLRIFCCVDERGLWKSTDGGVTWTGGQTTPSTFGTTTTYFDSPFQIHFNPSGSGRVYLTQGVRGNSVGFWRSEDNGETWTKPAGFISVCSTVGNGQDVTELAIDPTDFNHILLMSHSPWSGLSLSNAGVLESFDAGETWTTHMPEPTWSAGTSGIHFLYDPATGQGNSTTWLVGTEGNGHWRTTNSGGSWTKVSNNNAVHGGQNHLYLPDGRLLIGAANYPMVSTDNGQTFSQITGLPNSYYFGFWTDGTRLFTSPSPLVGGGNYPMFTSPIGDAVNWTALNAQTFIDGPLRIDFASNVLRSAQWTAGLWAYQL